MINMGGQRPKIGGNWPLTGSTETFIDNSYLRLVLSSRRSKQLIMCWKLIMLTLASEFTVIVMQYRMHSSYLLPNKARSTFLLHNVVWIHKTLHDLDSHSLNFVNRLWTTKQRRKNQATGGISLLLFTISKKSLE